MAVRLKPGKHRVKEGFPWIYRGEIEPDDLAASPEGSVVEVVDQLGHFVARGYINPQSMITIRVLTRRRSQAVDDALIAARLRTAAEWRHRVYSGRDAYRVVNSEADGLPGLIVDRFDRLLVLEVLTLGISRFLPVILETLQTLFEPVGIYERGTVRVRQHEGLPLKDVVHQGTIPDPLWIMENGVRMRIDLGSGQKTGHFLDQAMNRAAAARYAGGKSVFDVFCHTGGFGLAALAQGAASVAAVDSAGEALALARENAVENGFGERLTCEETNAFDWLRQRAESGVRYQLGILDPPAFTKSKDAVPGALRGYKEINLRALKLLDAGGILVTSSCSYHISEPEFIQVVSEAAADAKRHVRLLEIRTQSPDHPMLPALPESRYLKCLILGVD